MGEKIETKLFYFIFIILLIFTSCINNSNKTIETSDKYREKNLINSIDIELNKGNIQILGWSQNFIEINTKKILYSGLNNDLSFITTDINRKDYRMVIKTKIPPSIDGDIDLKIFVPYNLSFISINCSNGKININDFLGDLSIITVKTDMDINFHGSILKIDSYSSNVNLNIKNVDNVDVVIKNNNGNFVLLIDSLGGESFLDLETLSGKIDVYMNKSISHTIQLINIDGVYNFQYELENQKIIHSQHTMFSASYGKNEELKIYTTNNKSETNFYFIP